MLKKVRPAATRLIFPAGATSRHNAQRQRVIAGRRIADEGHAVGETVDLGGAHAATKART
jgi:hypothetical protein